MFPLCVSYTPQRKPLFHDSFSQLNISASLCKWPHAWSEEARKEITRRRLHKRGKRRTFVADLGPVKLKGKGLLFLLDGCRTVATAAALIVTVPATAVSTLAELQRLPFRSLSQPLRWWDRQLRRLVYIFDNGRLWQNCSRVLKRVQFLHRKRQTSLYITDGCNIPRLTALFVNALAQ